MYCTLIQSVQEQQKLSGRVICLQKGEKEEERKKEEKNPSSSSQTPNTGTFRRNILFRNKNSSQNIPESAAFFPDPALRAERQKDSGAGK